jgi:hypothetical protein
MIQRIFCSVDVVVECSAERKYLHINCFYNFPYLVRKFAKGYPNFYTYTVSLLMLFLH